MGDEQSIESNLSTFSAHVTNIADVLKTADERAMVLMDELGTGTDPDEGSALACAVLKELQQRGSLVFATTHLMGIKGYVQRTPGMVNASMEFDKKTFTPLYRLRTGEPGQSHALEIASRYGLPQQVIMAAKEMLGGGAGELEDLMADLQEKRADYERLVAELSRREAELQMRERLAEQKAAEAVARQREILAGAHRESLDVITDIKRQMRAELDAIKNKEKKEILERVKKIEEKQKQVTETLACYERDEGGTLSIDDVSIGDMVYVKSLGYDGTVAAVMAKANRVKVITGSKDVLVPLSDIRIRQGKELTEKTGRTLQQAASDETVSSRINLVGMRVDEALSRLEPFLNHATLAGYQEVTIIHGIGAGILQRAVREHLEGHPLVKKYRTGEPSEGGGGVTVVMLA
jgi:DNA mismatch repair protein MutS2